MRELTDNERAILLEPCPCGHSINDHGGLANCWLCDEDGGRCTVGNFEALLVERVDRIVASKLAAARSALAACREVREANYERNLRVNLRVLKHEAETPMRGHDEDGACCRRAAAPPTADPPQRAADGGGE